MAKATTTNGNGDAMATLVRDWAKAQAEVEDAQKTLDAARKKMGGFGQRIFQERGTELFFSKALGRKYRAVKKPGAPIRGPDGEPVKGENGKPLRGDDVFLVIPVAENEARDSY